MESFTTTRYDEKIETFDPCIIEVSSQQQQQQHQQREVTPNVVSQTTIQTVHENSDIICTDNNDVTIISENNEEQQVDQIQTNNIQQNMTLTPVRLPAILDGEFFSVIRVDDSNVTVKCLQCQKLLNGNLKSTGNFLSHLKRLHPLMLDKIKTKSNMRKPAIAYVDMSAEKCPEIVRTKRGYRKCYKTEELQNSMDESLETLDQNELESPSPPTSRRRKSDEPGEYLEDNGVVKMQNNSYIMEDEFDAIGKNVAAKLRNMRLDQRIVAEKLLNDVLFNGQLAYLQRDSSLQI